MDLASKNVVQYLIMSSEIGQECQDVPKAMFFCKPVLCPFQFHIHITDGPFSEMPLDVNF